MKLVRRRYKTLCIFGILYLINIPSSFAQDDRDAIEKLNESNMSTEQVFQREAEVWKECFFFLSNARAESRKEARSQAFTDCYQKYETCKELAKKDQPEPECNFYLRSYGIPFGPVIDKLFEGCKTTHIVRGYGKLKEENRN